VRLKSILLFVFGLVLIAASEVLERQGLIDERRLNAAFLVVESSLMAFLVSGIVVLLIDDVFSQMLQKYQRNHKVATFYFYFTNVRELVVALILF